MIFFSSCIIACFYLFLIFLIFSFRFSPATLLSPLSSCSLTHFQNINSQQFSITIFFTLDNKHSRKCHFLFDIMSLLERIFECVYMMLIIDVQTPCIDCGVNVIALVTVFGGPRSRRYSPGCIIFFFRSCWTLEYRAQDNGRSNAADGMDGSSAIWYEYGIMCKESSAKKQHRRQQNRFKKIYEQPRLN